MPHRDQHTYATLLQYLSFGGLALWGGVVSYYQRFLRIGRKFRLLVFTGELATSCLSGVVMFYLCFGFGISYPKTAAFTALAGYAGGKALELGERAIVDHGSRMFGISNRRNDGDDT